MALAARAMAPATEMAKATDGESSGAAKAFIVDESGGRWQWWSLSMAIVIDRVFLGMEGQ